MKATIRSVAKLAGVARVYQRHDWAGEKVKASNAWAAHVISTAEGRRAGDNITVLRGA